MLNHHILKNSCDTNSEETEMRHLLGTFGICSLVLLMAASPSYARAGRGGGGGGMGGGVDAHVDGAAELQTALPLRLM
jgi:hypothetical protein